MTRARSAVVGTVTAWRKDGWVWATDRWGREAYPLSTLAEALQQWPDVPAAVGVVLTLPHHD